MKELICVFLRASEDKIFKQVITASLKTKFLIHHTIKGLGNLCDHTVCCKDGPILWRDLRRLVKRCSDPATTNILLHYALCILGHRWARSGEFHSIDPSVASRKRVSCVRKDELGRSHIMGFQLEFV